MAQITNKITVDVAKKNLFQALVAKQNDHNSRFLKITLCNEGEKITVPSAASVIINAERADETSAGFMCTVNSDGTVTAPLTSWMLALDGVVKCSISVIDTEEQKLTSTSFSIEVEAAEFSDTDITDDENYDILIRLISDCADAKLNCETATAQAGSSAAAADLAAESANEAAAAANKAKDEADTAAVKANTVAETANKAANNANSAAEKANSAANSVNVAKDNAKFAASKATDAANAANQAAHSANNATTNANTAASSANSAAQAANTAAEAANEAAKTAQSATGPQGPKGDKGDPGAAGTNGKDGRGILSTAVTYQSSTSGAEIPTGTWSATIPPYIPAGNYLWTRTIITYTDSTISTVYSIGMIGAMGAKGDKGDKGDTGAKGDTGPQGPGFETKNYIIPDGTIADNPLFDVTVYYFNNIPFLVYVTLKQSINANGTDMYNVRTTTKVNRTVYRGGAFCHNLASLEMEYTETTTEVKINIKSVGEFTMSTNDVFIL